MHRHLFGRAGRVLRDTDIVLGADGGDFEITCSDRDQMNLDNNKFQFASTPFVRITPS